MFPPVRRARGLNEEVNAICVPKAQTKTEHIVFDQPGLSTAVSEEREEWSGRARAHLRSGIFLQLNMALSVLRKKIQSARLNLLSAL